jgi:ketosteroid isomerase-like protein
MEVKEIANKFIEAINQHDVESLCELITEDHTFIDSAGEACNGIEQMRRAWSEYFKMFPDYAIEAPEFVISGDTVILLGKASGTYTTDGSLRQENHWQIPAAWKAVIADDKIKLWQVFADNSIVVKIIKKEKEKLKGFVDE